MCESVREGGVKERGGRKSCGSDGDTAPVVRCRTRVGRGVRGCVSEGEERGGRTDKKGVIVSMVGLPY